MRTQRLPELGILTLILLLAACAPQPQAFPTASQTPSLSIAETTSPTAASLIRPAPSATSTPSIPTAHLAPCGLPPVVAPTAPAVTYRFAELDPTTGLHVTGQAQEIDPTSYQLLITGTVAGPLTLTLDDLRCLPRVEVACALVCPETFVDQATWAGVRLWDVLKLAGAPEEVSSIRLIGADGYRAWVPPSIAKETDSLLAYEWDGEPLPILHGFPLRGVFPAAPGNQWVKWLVRIEIR